MGRFQRLGAIPAFLVVVFAAKAQAQTTAVAQATKDPQAVSVLTAYVNASGAPAASAQDFIASGTITYYGGGKQVQAPATVKGLGATGFRIDAQLPQGTRSWVVDGLGGRVTNPDGSSSRVPWGNSASLLSATWPVPGVVAGLNDPNTQITYAGQTTFDGHAADDIQLQEVLPSTVDPNGELGAATARDLFIDSSTHLALGLRNLDCAVGTSRRIYAHELVFSDYRSANGILVPYSVAEFFTGQETWSFQLSSISFNTGLTATAFAY